MSYRGTLLLLIFPFTSNESPWHFADGGRVIPLGWPGGRVFTQVGRRGRGSSIDELWGHQHDSRPGAKPSWLSTLEESYILSYLVHVTESTIRLMSLTGLYPIIPGPGDRINYSTYEPSRASGFGE